MLMTQTFDIQVRRSTFGERDRHGNQRRVLGEPEALPVYGIAPATQAEPDEQGRRYATRAGWDIYAPTGTSLTPHDVVIFDGVEAELIGEVEVWRQTPFVGPTAVGGVRFTVERRGG